MSKLMLSNSEYEVWTGGTLRTIWSYITSIITRNTEYMSYSNWLVIDRGRKQKYRLTNEEQDLLFKLSEQLRNFESRRSRKKRAAFVLKKAIKEINNARMGDKNMVEHLKHLERLEMSDFIRFIYLSDGCEFRDS